MHTPHVGIIAHMKASLIIDFKDITPEGEIIQMRVWRVPHPVTPSEHPFKYSLFYGQANRRHIGFDNERGKGDHCHIDGTEFAYTFVTLEKLIEDFITSVEKRRAP
jgi:hypothetical protein